MLHLRSRLRISGIRSKLKDWAMIFCASWIIYAGGINGLQILAVMNLHRDPDYWKNREE